MDKALLQFVDFVNLSFSSMTLNNVVFSSPISGDVEKIRMEVRRVGEKNILQAEYRLTEGRVKQINLDKSEIAEAICKEFENFKRSKRIYQLIIELNDVEEECDKLYLTSMRELTKNSSDVLATISWREIYECFEACVDACEHVGECVGTVIMKNT